MECLSFCIAQTIDLTRLDQAIKKSFSEYISVKSSGCT